MSGDARRAQAEANGNTAAQERDDGMDDDPDDDEMGAQRYTSGNVSEEEENEEDYRDNDMTARDIINSQQIAICLDEPREAQYMAGFIALQMSRMWGMFEAGDKRTIDAALTGLPHVHTTTTWRATPTSLCLIVLVLSYHLLKRRFLILRVFDQGLSDQSRTATNIFAFRRPDAMLLQIVECGKYPRCHQGRNETTGQRTQTSGGEIVYRCFSLAFNCKYISFARTGLNLGKHGYGVDMSAIFAATDPGKCDGPLLHWCVRKGHWLADEHYKKYIRARTPNTTWTKNSVVVSLDWPSWTDLSL